MGLSQLLDVHILSTPIIYVVLSFSFIVTCEPLPIVVDGNYSTTNCSDTSQLPATLCSVECYDGYVLNGSANYTCLDSGEWSNRFDSSCQG